jgi:hypothetical protein
MKRLHFTTGTGPGGDVSPEDTFLNLYTDKTNLGNAVRISLADATHNRPSPSQGITVRIRRDVDGDFTITKIAEF